MLRRQESFRYTDRIDRAQPVLVGLDLVNELPKQIGEHLFQHYDAQEVAFDLLLETGDKLASFVVVARPAKRTQILGIRP